MKGSSSEVMKHRKLILRLVGALLFAFGAWVGSLGLGEHAKRMGGPDSGWEQVEAEVVAVSPHPQYENKLVQTFRLEVSGGEQVDCDVVRSPDTVMSVGDTTELWVHDDTSSGDCRIATENLDAGFTGAHFLMIFGAMWMLMGAAFIIRPPNRVHVGQDGSVPPV